MSCESGSHEQTVSAPGTPSDIARTISSCAAIARAVSMQPFGVPVLPDEYWTNATSSSSGGSGSSCEEPSSACQATTRVLPSDLGTRALRSASIAKTDGSSCAVSVRSCLQ